MSTEPNVHRHGRPPRRSLVLLVSAALAVVVTAGCAGGDERVGGVASLGGQTTTTRPGETGDPEESLRKFQKCMKENGVEDLAAGGVEARDDQATGKIDSDPDSAEARTKCDHLLSGITLEDGSPSLDPKVEDALVAYARCMRDEGVDMPDPTDGGLVAEKGSENFDPESAAFKQAHAKCRKHTDGQIPEAEPGE